MPKFRITFRDAKKQTKIEAGSYRADTTDWVSFYSGARAQGRVVGTARADQVVMIERLPDEESPKKETTSADDASRTAGGSDASGVKGMGAATDQGEEPGESPTGGAGIPM